MAPQPARFTFDLDLRRPDAREATLPEAAVQALVAQAREEGRAEGRIAGEQGATARAAQNLAAAAARVAQVASEMLGAIDDQRHAVLSEAVDLAASIGRKLAGHALGRYPTAEVEALVRECLSALDGVPHLVIRCAPELAERIRDTTTAQIATSSFTGRLVVMGEPDIAIGDCRIEWADGGLVRDINATSADINSKIAAFLAARERKGA